MTTETTTDLTEHSELRFRITTVDGTVFEGAVQGSGGLIGGGMMHLPRSRREPLELSRLQRVARLAAKNVPLPIYEPEPGCCCLYPGECGYGQPRHFVPLAGATVEVA